MTTHGVKENGDLTGVTTIVRTDTTVSQVTIECQVTIESLVTTDMTQVCVIIITCLIINVLDIDQYFLRNVI